MIADPPASPPFLSRAAQLLASSLSFDEVLRQAIGAALPDLGDFGFFDVVDGDTVRRTCAAHQADDIEALLAPTQWVRQQHPELNLCALSTGEAALHPSIDDGWYRRVAANDAHLDLLRTLAFTSMVTVPVRFQDELLGALTLFMGRSGRRHETLHLAAAADLAALVAAAVSHARLMRERARADAALRASEERLRLAVQAGQIGIWDWDIVHDRVSWSDRVYELHGLRPGEFGGTVGDFARLVHPDDEPRVRAQLEATLAGRTSYAVEFRVVLPDGRTRWLWTHAHLQRDAEGRAVRLVGATADIDERMKLLAAERDARAQAEAARRRLEVLAEAGAQLSGTLDPQATLDRIAAMLVPAIADWCRIDVVAADGSLERAVAHHVDPARARRGMDAVRRLRAAEDTPGSMAWCVRTGLSHRVVVNDPEDFAATGDADMLAFARAIGMRAFLVTPLTARGRTLGALAVLQAESGRGLDEEDAALVTELAQRAALALDNARLYAEAEAARRAAERASRAKDEFLAMLGHELRNPLAPIVTNLRLMAMHQEPRFERERRVIERQVANLATLVDDLLDVARIARGDVQLRREAIDLREVLHKAAEVAAPLLDQRRHALALHLPDAPMLMHGDPARLTQVFANLLTNAARYTPEGGHVELQAAPHGEGWRVAVRDDGRGIEPELLPRVFDLFVQGRQGLDRSTGGLGVGLAVVKNLVTLHGGSVSVSSAGPGQGSEFVVQLPAGDGGDAEEARAAPRDEPRGAPPSRRRILVVDDNRDAAEALATLLELEGHCARISLDPDDALAQAPAFRPEVAILDIGLPRLDGYALARKLRELPGLDALRLVALTGYGLADDRERSRAAGFAAHLVKPVDPDALIDTLARLT